VARRSDIEIALRRLAPRIPAHELGAVVDHAVDSPGLKRASPETAAAKTEQTASAHEAAGGEAEQATPPVIRKVTWLDSQERFSSNLLLAN